MTGVQTCALPISVIALAERAADLIKGEVPVGAQTEMPETTETPAA